MRDHVAHESRLELARLIFADYDRSVQRILARPFLLKAQVGGKIRKHIPDYFLATDHGPVVIDVKQARAPTGQADVGLHVRMDPAAGGGAELAV
jgi:hypothetical protein